MDDREKLIEIITQQEQALVPACIAEEIADFWIAKGITVKKWVPVTEKLPGMMQPVIVCRANGKVEAGCLDVNGWWKVYGTRTKRVTHWMPLPEPPKEDK